VDGDDPTKYYAFDDMQFVEVKIWIKI
jgi:hypothetical protein